MELFGCSKYVYMSGVEYKTYGAEYLVAGSVKAIL